MLQIPASLTEADIFARIVHSENGNLSREVSHLLLNLRFQSVDITYVNELAEKNNHGLLNETERQEIEKYLRVGNFLNLLHAKARQSLQKSN